MATSSTKQALVDTLGSGRVEYESKGGVSAGQVPYKKPGIYARSLSTGSNAADQLVAFGTTKMLPCRVAYSSPTSSFWYFGFMPRSWRGGKGEPLRMQG